MVATSASLKCGSKPVAQSTAGASSCVCHPLRCPLQCPRHLSRTLIRRTAKFASISFATISSSTSIATHIPSKGMLCEARLNLNTCRHHRLNVLAGGHLIASRGPKHRLPAWTKTDPGATLATVARGRAADRGTSSPDRHLPVASTSTSTPTHDGNGERTPTAVRKPRRSSHSTDSGSTVPAAAPADVINGGSSGAAAVGSARAGAAGVANGTGEHSTRRRNVGVGSSSSSGGGEGSFTSAEEAPELMQVRALPRALEAASVQSGVVEAVAVGVGEAAGGPAAAGEEGRAGGPAVRALRGGGRGQALTGVRTRITRRRPDLPGSAVPSAPLTTPPTGPEEPPGPIPGASTSSFASAGPQPVPVSPAVASSDPTPAASLTASPSSVHKPPITQDDRSQHPGVSDVDGISKDAAWGGATMAGSGRTVRTAPAAAAGAAVKTMSGSRSPSGPPVTRKGSRPEAATAAAVEVAPSTPRRVRGAGAVAVNDPHVDGDATRNNVSSSIASSSTASSVLSSSSTGVTSTPRRAPAPEQHVHIRDEFVGLAALMDFGEDYDKGALYSTAGTRGVSGAPSAVQSQTGGSSVTEQSHHNYHNHHHHHYHHDMALGSVWLDESMSSTSSEEEDESGSGVRNTRPSQPPPPNPSPSSPTPQIGSSSPSSADVVLFPDTNVPVNTSNSPLGNTTSVPNINASVTNEQLHGIGTLYDSLLPQSPSSTFPPPSSTNSRPSGPPANRGNSMLLEDNEDEMYGFDFSYVAPVVAQPPQQLLRAAEFVASSSASLSSAAAGTRRAPRGGGNAVAASVVVATQGLAKGSLTASPTPLAGRRAPSSPGDFREESEGEPHWRAALFRSSPDNDTAPTTSLPSAAAPSTDVVAENAAVTSLDVNASGAAAGVKPSATTTAVAAPTVGFRKVNRGWVSSQPPLQELATEAPGSGAVEMGSDRATLGAAVARDVTRAGTSETGERATSYAETETLAKGVRSSASSSSSNGSSNRISSSNGVPTATAVGTSAVAFRRVAKDARSSSSSGGSNNAISATSTDQSVDSSSSSSITAVFADSNNYTNDTKINNTARVVLDELLSPAFRNNSVDGGNIQSHSSSSRRKPDSADSAGSSSSSSGTGRGMADDYSRNKLPTGIASRRDGAASGGKTGDDNSYGTNGRVSNRGGYLTPSFGSSNKPLQPPGGWKPRGTPETTLFVKGLDPEAGEQALREGLMQLFGSAGRIVQVRLPCDPRSGLKGIGYVVFQSAEEKARAADLDGSELFGRVIRVDTNVGRPG